MKSTLQTMMIGNSPTRPMHSDGKKRRSFVAMLFTAGDLRRYVQKMETMIMSFDFSSFESFCNGWLNKANLYELNSLSDHFDKFFTTFVVFNRLYNEAGKILVKRNEPGLKLPRYKYAPLSDKASATDYVVRYYGENSLKREIQAEPQCVDSVFKIAKLIEDGKFYFHEDYQTGLPDTAKDLKFASKAKQFCPKSILSLIYAARCNMFHGSKEFSSIQEELLYNLNYLLGFITRKVFVKISSDLRS